VLPAAGNIVFAIFAPFAVKHLASSFNPPISASIVPVIPGWFFQKGRIMQGMLRNYVGRRRMG
jgi:hypothetical protein